MVRYTELAGRLPAYAGAAMKARFPEHYYKYLRQLEQPSTRVHDEKEEADILDYKLADRETRRVKRVPDTQVNVVYPEEANRGIWGGEGIVKGFYKYRTFYGHYLPRLFMPNLIASQVYSEILDVFLEVQVTERALQLFDKAMGFDNYILRTPVQDLRSDLALKLRRKMLISLAKQDYHPENKERHEYIKAKYADCVIPLEEAEWIGLTEEEALEKLKLEEHRANPVLPLKFQYRKELIAMLKDRQERGLINIQPVEKPAPSIFAPIQSMFGRFRRRASN